MPYESQHIITEVVRATDNDFVLFFALIVISLVVFFLPLYSMIRKDKKIYVDIITNNTEVCAGLKSTMELNNQLTSSTISRIHERIDGTHTQLTEINVKLAAYIAGVQRNTNQGE